MTLRAAKIYATTYNVETAVAYDTAFMADSVSDKIVTVVRGFIVVRKLTRAELEADDDRLNNVITREIIVGFGDLPSDSRPSVVMSWTNSGTWNRWSTFPSAGATMARMLHQVRL